MKHFLNLVVSIEFDGPVTSATDIEEVVGNVNTGIFHQLDTSWLAPRAGNVSVKEITTANLDSVAVMGKIRKIIKSR